MMEMLQQASSYAADVDGLIILVAVLSGFWFFVAQAVFFWLIFRYRAKPGKKSKVYRGPYEYGRPDRESDFWPQDEPAQCPRNR